MIIALKWAAFIWIIGSMGSLEIDRIGFFQFLLQIIIGGLVWVCANVLKTTRPLTGKLNGRRQIIPKLIIAWRRNETH